MTNWYSVNWIETTRGNAFEEGTKLTIKINKPNVDHISGAIYKNGSPVIALFGKGNTASVIVKRQGRSLKGHAVLKIRGYFKDARGFGIDDAFEIL